MPPRAIETRYSGCRFRSRLEARWAVYLNAIKAKWVYEPEGFVLSDGTRYLPDFFVYAHQDHAQVNPGIKGFWLEVKPVEPTESEAEKMRNLCFESGCPGFIAVGKFPAPDMHIFTRDRAHILHPRNRVVRDARLLLSLTAPDGAFIEDFSGALAAAAEARFEHGDRPAV